MKWFKKKGIWFSVGFEVDKDGTITDGRTDAPGFRAGLVPGMKLLGVGGRTYSGDHFDEALRAAQGSNEPIEIVVQWGEEVRVVQVDYSGGPRYPHLEAVPGKPDTLSAVLAPRAKKL